MSNKRPVLTAAAVIAASYAATTPSYAEEAAVNEASAARQWHFHLMPYVWGSGVSGSIRPFAGAPTLEFDRSFSDTLDSLDAAFFLSGGAERGRVVLIGDFSHVSTSQAGTVPPGVPAEGAMRQTTLTTAAGYKAIIGPNYSVDVFGGLRTFWLRAEVDVAGGALSASPRETFVNPMFGARGSYKFAPRWSALGYADIGGFGAGTDLTLVASAMINFHATPRITLSGGYRSMWIDYDNGNTIADISASGPLFGVGFRF